MSNLSRVLLALLVASTIYGVGATLKAAEFWRLQTEHEERADICEYELGGLR